MSILTIKQISLLLIIFTTISCFTFSFNKPNKFQSNPYDINTSKKYAAYSSITHCPKTCITNWSCGTILKYPKLINVTYI